MEKLRLLYLAGPGDATSVLRAMAEGREDDGIAHVAYSRQVFEACRDMDVPMLAMCVNPRRDDFSFGDLRSMNVADPLANKSRLGYHLANITFARYVGALARQFSANVVITATEPYPFLLEPLAFRGVHVIPALHALMWSAFRKRNFPRWLMTRLSRHFYARTCPAILSHPGLAVQQVHELTQGKPRPIVEFLPLFPRDMFANSARPDPAADEFRVLTVGRCEEFKGAFDLIEIAKRVRALGGSRMRFDWCGTGGAIEEGRRRVQAEGLADSFAFHGWTSMEDLASLWGRSHICVVPTTSSFVEGFNQVVIEAALAGRPVITSAVCPSLDFVRACSIEVTVDDIDGYVRALVSLADDRSRYAALQSRCAEVVRPFFDKSNSFGAAVRHVLEELRTRGEVRPVSHPPVTA